MSTKLKNSTISFNLNTREIEFSYSVTKSLIDKDSAMDQMKLVTVFDALMEGSPEYLKGVSCSKCSNLLVSLPRVNKRSCIYNLNFDYIGSMELLSCHESHTENIIPDLDKKLKSVYAI